jgi:hypothetical protein
VKPAEDSDNKGDFKTVMQALESVSTRVAKLEIDSELKEIFTEELPDHVDPNNNNWSWMRSRRKSDIMYLWTVAYGGRSTLSTQEADDFARRWPTATRQTMLKEPSPPQQKRRLRTPSPLRSKAPMQKMLKEVLVTSPSHKKRSFGSGPTDHRRSYRSHGPFDRRRSYRSHGPFDSVQRIVS